MRETVSALPTVVKGSHTLYYSPLPTRAMVESGYPLMPMDPRAAVLLRNNIRALLVARKETQSSLAAWLRHSRSWINKFLNGDRQVQLKDLDRIADFFGLATYHLFQPGIGSLTERRVSDRRQQKERRGGYALRQLEETRAGMGTFRRTNRDLPVSVNSVKQKPTHAATSEVGTNGRSSAASLPPTDPVRELHELRGAINRTLIQLGSAAADPGDARPAPSALPHKAPRRRVVD